MWYACMCACVCACMSAYVCGAWRLASQNFFSFSLLYLLIVSLAEPRAPAYTSVAIAGDDYGFHISDQQELPNSKDLPSSACS